MHLRKAKLMFFYTRYPSSSILKMYFPDVMFNKNNTAQLVKWFSNFRRKDIIHINQQNSVSRANRLLSHETKILDGSQPVSRQIHGLFAFIPLPRDYSEKRIRCTAVLLWTETPQDNGRRVDGDHHARSRLLPGWNPSARVAPSSLER
ncbi:hypothetical protein RRG08_049991 [Elysia crispata]|uniref:Prospero domain-containing protein n=1 Tax=Elysia crispata TaxID=231223 RepID=A0AAE1BB15_9GAST|nr:hypothetical protein RRG08_049991 [Elysia crispata]